MLFTSLVAGGIGHSPLIYSLQRALILPPGEHPSEISVRKSDLVSWYCPGGGATPRTEWGLGQRSSAFPPRAFGERTDRGQLATRAPNILPVDGLDLVVQLLLLARPSYLEVHFIPFILSRLVLLFSCHPAYSRGQINWLFQH